MANQILIKNSATPGKVPAVADLALGELALNTNDGILFFRKNNSGVDSVLQINPETINPVTSVNGNVGDVIVSPASIGAINTNLIGIANGVAALDVSGRVPKTQLPDIQTNLSISRQVPALSGTTIIPYDNTTPVITEGTEIATASYIPSDPLSKMVITGCFNVSCGSNTKVLIVAVFRNSTCVGATALNYISANKPQLFPFVISDLDMGASFNTTITYSVRFGVGTSATWYVNRGNNNYLNGMMTKNSINFAEYL